MLRKGLRCVALRCVIVNRLQLTQATQCITTQCDARIGLKSILAFVVLRLTNQIVLNSHMINSNNRTKNCRQDVAQDRGSSSLLARWMRKKLIEAVQGFHCLWKVSKAAKAKENAWKAVSTEV